MKVEEVVEYLSKKKSWISHLISNGVTEEEVRVYKEYIHNIGETISVIQEMEKGREND